MIYSLMFQDQDGFDGPESSSPIGGTRMALWELANHLPLVQIKHTDRPVGASEEGEEGVELVDAGEGGDRPALGEGGCLHQLVLGWLSWIGG